MTDPWWASASLAKRRDNLALRGRAKSALADWFQSAGFVEVETPALQISPGLEPHLAAFETRLLAAGHYGSDDPGQPYYLHTSPEFAMKKLLAGGMEKIWQLCPVYRNAEGSPTHSPEFKMLEWY
ncbi:MAG: EF-P lysine aminoacylase GenX, partial [Rhodospirillaceae bacterium]|nr:EF-P lysine aminoacylase GenX [Rhodospirillaceae bacterium]